MKETKLTKLGSVHDLPVDLWPEILSKLPVKSLVQFRCVSKSWRSLIDDPNFARLHLSSFKNNCDETHLFVVKGWGGHPVVRCSETFKITTRLGFRGIPYQPINTLPDPTPGRLRGLDVVCTIDGLVMLKDCTLMLKSNLMLWNPSIRKCRRLLGFPKSSSYIRKYVDLGMGYVPLIKDYKLVRLAFDNQGLSRIGVYTIGSGSWKTIQFQVKGQSNWCWYVDNNRRPVCFGGCLYTIALNEDSRKEELVSFDLSTELFAFTNLPKSSHGYPPDALILVDGGSSLAVFDYWATEASIWVLESSGADNESLYWTKCYTFPVGIREFLYLKKNGDVLMMKKPGKRQVVSYNVETQQAMILLKHCRIFDSFRVSAYIESLIHP